MEFDQCMGSLAMKSLRIFCSFSSKLLKGSMKLLECIGCLGKKLMRKLLQHQNIDTQKSPENLCSGTERSFLNNGTIFEGDSEPEQSKPSPALNPELVPISIDDAVPAPARSWGSNVNAEITDSTAFNYKQLQAKRADDGGPQKGFFVGDQSHKCHLSESEALDDGHPGPSENTEEPLPEMKIEEEQTDVEQKDSRHHGKNNSYGDPEIRRMNIEAEPENTCNCTHDRNFVIDGTRVQEDNKPGFINRDAMPNQLRGIRFSNGGFRVDFFVVE